MLTVFAIPKPFQGPIKAIQRNAIGSWTRLHPDCEIFLCGNDLGTQDASFEFVTEWISDVERNEYGTPLLNSVFDRVERECSHSLLCYVNADIILTKSLITAIEAIPFKKFVMMGQRWDVDLACSIDFEDLNWENRIKRRVTQLGLLHPPSGSDYFVFPKGVMGRLPPFAVGRPAWDNWLIYRCRTLGIPVIDATKVAMVIHQNHDYVHVKQRTDSTWEGPEAARNRQLAEGWDKIFNVRDATHILKPMHGASRDASCILHRNWLTLPVPFLRAQKKFGYLAGAVVRVLKRSLTS